MGKLLSKLHKASVSREEMTKSTAFSFASHGLLSPCIKSVDAFPILLLSLFSDYYERVVANKLSYLANQLTVFCVRLFLSQWDYHGIRNLKDSATSIACLGPWCFKCFTSYFDGKYFTLYFVRKCFTIYFVQNTHTHTHTHIYICMYVCMYISTLSRTHTHTKQ